MPTHASYRSESEPFFAGALVFAGENQYLSFAAGDNSAFADLKSGEVQISPPESPRGWFNNWRLLQRGPNGFENILAVTAVNPREPARAAPTMMKKKDPARERSVRRPPYRMMREPSE
jgi:hypothetical protein